MAIFDRIAFAILLIPYLFVFMKQQRIHKVHREKEKLRKEFREMMISIGNSLSAGYSIENALKTAKMIWRCMKNTVCWQKNFNC